MAVINARYAHLIFIVLIGFGVSQTGHCEVLPEDRADVLFHSYDGGGVTIQGPSVLVRKGIKDKVSISANLYQDVVSSASIDVLASGASKYSEERNEYSLGVDYLVDKATLSLGVGNSTENDYIADSYSMGISQAFFGDMTTMTMGYSYGDNIVRRNGKLTAGEKAFEATNNSQRFRIGLTQILTKNWIIALRTESVVDEGYLNNPYRSVRYIGPNGDSLPQPEVYPETRNSDAVALRTSYYLPYRASISLEARTFKDSWGIDAHNVELRYTHPIREKLIIELKMRNYSQGAADFYADLYPYFNAQEFLARDKELSEFTSSQVGVGATYQFDKKILFADKETLSLFWDLIQYDYQNFRNQLLSKNEPAKYQLGKEPTYGFEANAVRLYFSVFY